mmetsp:Transcript_64178/g.180646  ORF Transcript_64178/g.180646 Transcript_64178/m.180646 type:complete len:236 (+) Transcript_64178:327-1034(+)
MPVCRVVSFAPLTASFASMVERRPMPAISSAICMAVAMSSLAGTTCATSPAFSASAALMFRPVRMRAMAFDLPTLRMRRCVPPAPGMTPSLISGWPKTALSLAMMMSHIIAISQPPPKAKPLTAAITGTLQSATHVHDLNLSEVVMSAKERGYISLMSAPAAKALPSPVRTMQPVSGSAAAAPIAAPKSLMSASQSAFNDLVRTRVRTTTRPRRSARTFSVCEIRASSLSAADAV